METAPNNSEVSSGTSALDDGLAICSQHVGEYPAIHLCGKPAKWRDPKSGRYLCGVHRRVVDRFNKRINSPFCVRVANVISAP